MSEVKIVDIKGLLDTYEFPVTLPGSGQELLIKPITTGQMKKVLAYEDENDPFIVEEALDRLISDCVLTPEFDVKNIYLQDRFSLLLEIRKVTKGDSYQFNWHCPKCKVENVANILVSELPVKPFNHESDNVIKINDKLQFEVDFPTRYDQIDSIQRFKPKPLNYRERQVEVKTGTYANSIKKVHTPEGIMENIGFDDKVYILDNISSDVFENFTKWFEDNDFGTEFEEQIQCLSCGNTEKVDIPLTDFFV
jgi:hypothetical protein